MCDAHFSGGLASLMGSYFALPLWPVNPHRQAILSTVSKVHTGCSVQTGPLSAAGGLHALTDHCCFQLTGVVQTLGHWRGSCLWQAVPLQLWALLGIPQPGGGGPKLAVGVLPHSAASTHMHIFPKSLRPHTATARHLLQSTTVLANICRGERPPVFTQQAITLHLDLLEPGAPSLRLLHPGTKLVICLNSGWIF